MENKYLISVIVPAYNVAEWLPHCLDSILSQTYKRLEVILIDDGSIDGTSDIADMYAKKDPRIVVIHQPNEGIAAVREKGIALATGDYVGFVDSDDYIEPDMYERLLKNAVTCQADISHCGVNFCYPDGRKESHYGTGKFVVQDHYHGLKDLLEGTMIEPGLWNKLYRAPLLKDSCLDLNVLNNEDLLRNYVLFDRAEKSVYEDFCGYQYVQRIGSMSKDKNRFISSAEHIMKARRIIVEHAADDIYPYAMRLWLSTYVNVVNETIDSKDLSIIEFRNMCREHLGKEKKNIRYLIRRQRIAAYLIIYFPALHKIAYSLYKR